jgi:tetratricopeptide (TPR) repeat protein
MTGLGALAEAYLHFAEATRVHGGQMLSSGCGVWEAELKLTAGDGDGARAQTQANRAACGRNGWNRSGALCETLLGRCALPGDPGRAGAHLAAARGYGSRAGDIEVTLRCYHLAAEIARHDRDFPRAVTETLNGIQLADSHGFGRWSLDIRTELAKIYLAAGEPAKAIEPAEWVLRRAQEEDCQYAWGVADSLHLLGVAHAQLGDTAKAREYLTQAVEKRKPLEHPGLKETRAELRKLGR